MINVYSKLEQVLSMLIQYLCGSFKLKIICYAIRQLPSFSYYSTNIDTYISKLIAYNIPLTCKPNINL